MPIDSASIISRSQKLEVELFINRKQPEAYKNDILEILDELSSESLKGIDSPQRLTRIFRQWRIYILEKFNFLYAKDAYY